MSAFNTTAASIKAYQEKNGCGLCEARRGVKLEQLKDQAYRLGAGSTPADLAEAIQMLTELMSEEV